MSLLFQFTSLNAKPDPLQLTYSSYFLKFIIYYL